MRKLLMLLVIAALVMLDVPAARAGAGATDLPFRMDGSGTIPFFVILSGTGHGTQIGKASIRTVVLFLDISRPAPPCGSGTNAVGASEALTAANGDTLNQSISGGFCRSGPSLSTIHVTATYTITGGTGRFSSATGSGTKTTDLDFSSSSFTQSERGTINLN